MKILTAEKKSDTDELIMQPGRLKILFLCHEYPSPSAGVSLRSYNFLKNLYEIYNHEITLISFQKTMDKSEKSHSLDEYCDLIGKINLPASLNGASFKSILYTLKNAMSLDHIIGRNHIFSIYYSPEMKNKIQYVVASKKFDVVLVDSLPMAYYVFDENIPKVVDAMDAVTESIHQRITIERNIAKKILWYILYLEKKRYAKNVQKNNFDSWIAISSYDKSILNSYLPTLNIHTIPNGVDLEYYAPMNTNEEISSLVFVGDMNSNNNVEAVFYFIDNIYPLIRKKAQTVKLYIVGRNPPDKIMRLSANKSITVTGYVNDVRPFLNQASVIVVPMISGMGIKNKILEPMAMGKAVVSTSIGARGLDVISGENIFIADRPEDFARSVLELLDKMELRQNIGNNAIKFVVDNHSWSSMTDKLNKILYAATKS